MENRKARHIARIERLLNSDRIIKEQREALVNFDRFNELEVQCSLGTRKSYLQTLHDLAINIPQPFETMTKEDLQDYIANKKLHDTDGTVMLRQVHIKRFFRWIKWVEVNENKRDEEQVDIKSVEPPYCVRWIKQRYVESDIEFEDLPTEEEVLRIASCVNSQRDRALILSLWETGSSPIEILSL